LPQITQMHRKNIVDILIDYLPFLHAAVGLPLITQMHRKNIVVLLICLFEFFTCGSLVATDYTDAQKKHC